MQIQELYTLTQDISCPPPFILKVLEHNTSDSLTTPTVTIYCEQEVLCYITRTKTTVSQSFRLTREALAFETEDSILLRIRQLFYTAVIHEVDEWFTYKNKRVTHPHKYMFNPLEI